MNLTKFLIIDFLLMLLGIPLVLFLQSKNFKDNLWGNGSENNVPDQTFINLPNLRQILDLEALARKEGSGIKFDELVGLWKFVSVWKEGTDQKDSFSSTLLRLFSANLKLSKNQINQNNSKFDITNSIRFGILAIKFNGCGVLKGKQPLLPFYFEEIQLLIGNNDSFTKTLNIPEDNQRPFFALISIGENHEWLAARGRGGGLALWVKAS